MFFRAENTEQSEVPPNILESSTCRGPLKRFKNGIAFRPSIRVVAKKTIS